jgi:hypothetical protein
MQSYTQYHEISHYCKCDEHVVKIKDVYWSGAKSVTHWTCQKITDEEMLKRKHCDGQTLEEAYIQSQESALPMDL